MGHDWGRAGFRVRSWTGGRYLWMGTWSSVVMPGSPAPADKWPMCFETVRHPGDQFEVPFRSSRVEVACYTGLQRLDEWDGF